MQRCRGIDVPSRLGWWGSGGSAGNGGAGNEGGGDRGSGGGNDVIVRLRGLF
ncbi:hypothetical protein [Sorangium sp. So ce1153]|uniref:hypothetical protein n=1 Tax=Sorangium sp. So ce1153 TaxID=3133333 RepID=UPI003F63E3E2